MCSTSATRSAPAPRLRYPLGYWNANGAMFGIAVALLLWMSRRAALGRAALALGRGRCPAVLLALYFTYSRGGLLALVVAAGCLLALSRDRLWLLATLAIGALGALPAVLAVQARDSLADNLAGQAIGRPGGDGAADPARRDRARARRSSRRCAGSSAARGALTGRAVALSRSPTVLKADRPGRRAGRRSAPRSRSAAAPGTSSPAPTSSSPSSPQQHFSELSGAGRHDFWRVAIDAFGEKPLARARRRHLRVLLGAAALDRPARPRRPLALPGGLRRARRGRRAAGPGPGRVPALVRPSAAWRDAPRSRSASATRPASRRCSPSRSAPPSTGSGRSPRWARSSSSPPACWSPPAARSSRRPRAATPRGEGRRFGLAVAGLAVAWIAALALIGPLLVDHEIDASQSGGRRRQTWQRRRPRRNAPARSSPGRPRPTCSSACSPSCRANYPTAIAHFTQAIEREDHNWQLYYLRSEVEHEAGDEAAAQADLERRGDSTRERACEGVELRMSAETERSDDRARRRTAAAEPPTGARTEPAAGSG